MPGELAGLVGPANEPVPGARYAGLPQTGFHLRLVTEILGCFHREALDAEVLANPGQGHLELLQGPEQPVGRAQSLGDALHGPGDLDRIQAILDPPVGSEPLTDRLREPLEGILRDEAEPHVA